MQAVTDEAMLFLTRALGDAAAGIALAGVDPTPAGPRVRWEIPRLSRPRAGSAGAPDRAHVAELVSRMVALRWRDGPAPREVPAECYLQLHDDYPAVFTTTLETPAGWHFLLAAAAEWVLEDGPPAGHVTRQVKEKFGTLRWYIGGSTPEQMLLIVDAAGWLSGCVCDVCGAPGSVRPGGWIRTLCDDHADKKRRR